MKKIWLPTLLLLVLVPAVKAQTCDCTIAPFTPEVPCKKTCKSALRALSTATVQELQKLGLDITIALRIANWPGRHSAETLNDYKGVLTNTQIRKVGRKLSYLNDRQLEYFEKPASERERIRNGVNDPFKRPVSLRSQL